MKKGLGAIIASTKIEAEKARIEKGQAIACPLCGREMEFNGVAWFCYATECEEVRAKLYNAFLIHQNRDDWQSQILAAVVIDGGISITLRTVRGGYGRTNLRVCGEDSSLDRSEIPTMVARNGWVWQDWVADCLKKRSW